MLARALQSLPLDQLQSERSECLAALLAIAKGRKVQRTGFDGRSVDYTPADTARLESLIADLDAAIQAKTTGTPTRRPLHPVY